MRSPTATELLAVWERGINQTLLQKTIDLLSVACPEMDADAIAELSIGQRDARLLLLREWMFGPCLMNMAYCPKCSERVEWETAIDDIRLESLQQRKPSKELSLKVDEFNIRFRLPTSIDVSKVFSDGAEPDPTKLLANCILEARRKSKICEVDDLPDKVLQRVTDRIEHEDPQADIRMEISCPHCSNEWESYFDIVSYFWTEINLWAKRMLQEVHCLAKAYGWTEHDILSMNPVRRRLYLGLVNS